MKSTISLVIITMLLLGACSPTEEESASNFTVGILVAGGSAFQSAVDGFIEGMTEFDHVDGEDITYLYAEEGAELTDTVNSYIEQEVDVILAVTGTATLIATEATDTIPIVAAIIPYSVELGLAESLSQPNGNYTGIDIGPVTIQRFELLIEMFPDVEQVYIPTRVGDETTQIELSLLRPVAQELGVELVIEEFETFEEVEAGISMMPEEVDAIFTPSDVVVAGQLLPNWSQEAINRGIPHVHISRANQGPVFTFGPNLFENGQQAANSVHQVLTGTPVGDIPIQIGEFYLTINLQTAHAAGLEVSDDILVRANDIIRVESE